VRNYDGNPGQPTGGTIFAPTSDSEAEFGAYDPDGNPVVVDYHIFLGHELCGHAALLDRGVHIPGDQIRGNRPGHDEAIDEENRIREEQRLTIMRGKWGDPQNGESFSRRRS
jgi:hypothetical protein